MALFQINYKGHYFRKMDKPLEVIFHYVLGRGELFCALQIHNFWGQLTVAAILKHCLPDPKERMVPTGVRTRTPRCPTSGANVRSDLIYVSPKFIRNSLYNTRERTHCAIESSQGQQNKWISWQAVERNKKFKVLNCSNWHLPHEPSGIIRYLLEITAFIWNRMGPLPPTP